MRIDFDNTVTLLRFEYDDEKEAYNFIRKQSKTMAPGAKYMYQHKLYLKTKGKQGWDGKVGILNNINPSNNTAIFPTGMLPQTWAGLSHMISSKIEVHDLRAKPKIIPNPNYTVPLRDYQSASLIRALQNNIEIAGHAYYWPCGVLKIATGGGKTELAVAMYEAQPVPTVFVVHRKHLLTQTIDRFAKYGVHAGQIGDSVFDPDPAGVTVATVQTLHKTLKEGDPAKINKFIKAQQIFFDEAHLCASKVDKGNQFILLSRQFRHAFFRWGLTATPFMKDQYSNQLLMGATGELLCDVSNDMLIKRGHLTPPRVKIITVPKVAGPTTWPDVYDSAIILNRWRNLRIIDELATCPKPAFVMCTRLAHAKVLHNLAKEKGLSIPAIQFGGTKNKDRSKMINDLQSGKEKAIIATTIYDDGLDLPELRTLIFAGGGKSMVAQLQRIGRGLRTAAGKHEVLVVDFNDTSGRTMKLHSTARRKVWEQEGFTIEEID